MVFGDGVVVLPRLGGEHVLHVLLGQRRAALLVAVVHIGLHERAEDALHIDAGMVEEALVLTGHHGLLHGLGDLLQRNDLAVLGVELGKRGFAVVEIHRRTLGKTGHVEVDSLDGQGRDDGFRRAVDAEHGGQEKQARHQAAAYA